MSVVARLLLLATALGSALSFGGSRRELYCESYTDCRRAFLANAAAFVATLPPPQRARAELSRWVVPSRTDTDLTVDFLYVPAAVTPKHLMILSSGVHGVEGFAGSAVQALLLKELLPTMDRSTLGVLVIHCVNPYGMKYLRRVSENNVDLNRNFAVDRKLFETKNEGYEKLNSLLNPETPLSLGVMTTLAFYGRIAGLLLREPLKTLRQATLGGQYRFPRGVYFGGSGFEPQKEALEAALLARATSYEDVLALDLHTGYGSRGVLHLIAGSLRDETVARGTKAIFAGYPLDTGDADDFYDTAGDFLTYVTDLLTSRGKVTVPMTLEYGTVDNQTTLGGIASIRTMIAENQLHWHGAESDGTKQALGTRFLEMYFPKDEAWRDAVMRVTAERLPVFIDRFRKGAASTR